MLNFFRKKKSAEETTPKKKRGFFRELVNDILFALIAVTIIRGLFIEAFAIPTGSMENSMLIGDHLFVSKLHYGARTPKTLIKFPLAHQKFWGTNIPSYLDWIQLPQYRLPGFRGVRRGEPVVFNYPPDREYPTDIKTFYVKRCVAIPGDTFEVANKQFYINGEASENPPNMQTSFFVETDKGVHLRYMKELNITDYSEKDPRTGSAIPSYVYNNKRGFYIQADEERADKLRQFPSIKSVEEITYHKGGDGRVFPKKPGYDWSRDFFGPLIMPSKGWTIELTKQNIDFYGDCIKYYEGNDDVEIKDGVVTIEGEAIKEYTFKQGYYFMCGDNRHNSEDSRDWGFVPQDHIVGKPLFVFWSIDRTDPRAGFFSKIRWGRIFSLIK